MTHLKIVETMWVLGFVFVWLSSPFFWDVPCHTREEWRPQIWNTSWKFIWIHLAQDRDSCEYSDEPLGSIKCSEFD